MGEEPRASGTAVTSSTNPEQIQREIEETREQLGDTVEALAAKTDVKARATATMSRASERVRRRPAPAIAIGVIVVGLLARRMLKN